MSVILPDTPTGNPESEADERKRLLAEMKEMDEVDMSEGFTTGLRRVSSWSAENLNTPCETLGS